MSQGNVLFPLYVMKIEAWRCSHTVIYFSHEECVELKLCSSLSYACLNVGTPLLYLTQRSPQAY